MNLKMVKKADIISFVDNYSKVLELLKTTYMLAKTAINYQKS